MSFEKVEFKTLDGITLRGNLYAAKTKGPAIILGPGVRFQVLIEECF